MNLAWSLQYAAERAPEAEALVDGGTRRTYGELLDRVRRLAAGLAALDVTRGDRVAAVLKNRHELIELFWASQWLGAWFVPLSWRASADDVAYCIDDAAATVLAFEEASIAHAETASDPGRRTIGVGADVESDVPFTSLLSRAEARAAFDLDEREISIMLYTSGTTGRPKGVPRSHRAERAGGLSQALQHGYLPGDRTLGVMPLYHTMGDHSMIAMSLIGGCYVCQPDWHAARALALIESERISSLYLAPTLFHDLVHDPACDPAALSSVRALGYAGAAMTSALVERCAATFEPEVFVNHYGSTEIYTYSLDRNQRAKPGCAGRPALNARLRLVAPTEGTSPEETVEPGDEGQIVCHLSSDEAFSAYWNRPDADARAIRDGWYYTGDLGRRDRDGDLWIVGRVDDMIISGGENIHPLEIEDVLAHAPGVQEVAVVGAPDERLGQRVVACVVASGGVSADDLDAHCLAAEGLARFKRPREYRFVDSLPKSPSGKILRRALREGDGS